MREKKGKDMGHDDIIFNNIDLSVGGSENVTTAGTTKFYVSDDSAQVQALKSDINKLKTEINKRDDYITWLKKEVENAKPKTVKEVVVQDLSGFTKEELKFILTKVHPDKNPNSKIATALTTKLLKTR